MGAEARIRRIHLPPFRIDLTVRAGVPRVVPEVTLARAVAAALGAASAPAPASVGLVLTDDAELAELNERHRGIAAPTDVLSFPFLPPEAFPPHEGGGPGATRSDDAFETPPDVFAQPPGARRHLGDIVVSVERAAEQAAEGRGGQTGDVRWSTGDELRLLATHGALHLCGWDHAEPAEEAAMRKLERMLLASGRPTGRQTGPGRNARAIPES